MHSSDNIKLTDAYGSGVEFSFMGDLRTVEPTRLVGATFDLSGNAGAVDTNFWTPTVASNGTVVQGNSQVVLSTTVTSQNGSAKLCSVRRARYVGGYSMRYRAVIQVSAKTASNKRRWGIAYGATPATSVTDGAWFQFDGTTFSIVTSKTTAGGGETKVDTGNFNGQLGATWEPTADTAYTFECYWTNSKCIFVVGDKILHTVTASSATWADTMSFYVYMDNVNSNNIQTNHTLSCRTASIYRLGKIQTDPIYKHITSATTTVCKYGPGCLHSVVINNPTNNAITIYDNYAASGSVIAIINPGSSAVPVVLSYNVPFSVGLAIVTAGTPDLTVIYE